MKSVMVAYFDGVVSISREVLLSFDGKMVHLRGEGIEHTYPVTALNIPAGVGSVRRVVNFPNGGMCELEDLELLSALEDACGGKRIENVIHLWEKSLPLILTSVALTALLVVLFVRYGVPPLARHAAFALPAATESSIGNEVLKSLDRIVMKPSKLSKERRDELAILFRRVAGDGADTAGYRLEFRDSPVIGANAIALPSGIVVITDGLVELARQDDEIAAILAHELGHVYCRHALRHVLQSSAAGLVMATLTGDLASITALAATLPVVLVDASFSRGFEREADDAAIAWMRTAGVEPRRYAEILGRLQAQMDVKNGVKGNTKSPVRNYLTSHPDTGERIRRILNND
jgi:Zn-dependent protease with chaperone function